MKRILLLLVTLGLFVIAFFVYSFFSKSYSLENQPTVPVDSTPWYEQTKGIHFLTATATITPSLTNTVPTPTPTSTFTFTPTLTPTNTLSPTARLRPRTATPANLSALAADMLSIAETTMVALHGNSQESTPGMQQEMWFEVLGNPGTLNANEIYTNADCSWMGVAGLVSDLRNEPIIGMYIQVGGFPDGEIRETLSGLYPNYGESGYEITLARPVQSFEAPLWIQVYNTNHIAVSEKFYFKPAPDCDKSLILINFQKIR